MSDNVVSDNFILTYGIPTCVFHIFEIGLMTRYRSLVFDNLENFEVFSPKKPAFITIKLHHGLRFLLQLLVLLFFVEIKFN